MQFALTWHGVRDLYAALKSFLVASLPALVAGLSPFGLVTVKHVVIWDAQAQAQAIRGEEGRLSV